jgi:hypothetical protein
MYSANSSPPLPLCALHFHKGHIAQKSKNSISLNRAVSGPVQVLPTPSIDCPQKNLKRGLMTRDAKCILGAFYMVLAHPSRRYSHWLGFPYLLNGYSFTLFERLKWVSPDPHRLRAPRFDPLAHCPPLLSIDSPKVLPSGTNETILTLLPSCPHSVLITALAPFGLAPCSMLRELNQ